MYHTTPPCGITTDQQVDVSSLSRRHVCPWVWRGREQHAEAHGRQEPDRGCSGEDGSGHWKSSGYIYHAERSYIKVCITCKKKKLHCCCWIVVWLTSLFLYHYVKSPWLETKLLSLDAARVVTLEYTDITSEHPKIVIMSPEVISEKFLKVIHLYGSSRQWKPTTTFGFV